MNRLRFFIIISLFFRVVGPTDEGLDAEDNAADGQKCEYDNDGEGIVPGNSLNHYKNGTDAYQQLQDGHHHRTDFFHLIHTGALLPLFLLP